MHGARSPPETWGKWAPRPTRAGLQYLQQGLRVSPASLVLLHLPVPLGAQQQQPRALADLVLLLPLPLSGCDHLGRGAAHARRLLRRLALPLLRPPPLLLLAPLVPLRLLHLLLQLLLLPLPPCQLSLGGGRLLRFKLPQLALSPLCCFIPGRGSAALAA